MRDARRGAGFNLREGCLLNVRGSFAPCQFLRVPAAVGRLREECGVDHPRHEKGGRLCAVGLGGRDVLGCCRIRCGPFGRDDEAVEGCHPAHEPFGSDGRPQFA